VGKWRGDRLNLLEFLGFLGKVERKREVERKNRAFLPPNFAEELRGFRERKFELDDFNARAKEVPAGGLQARSLFILGRRNDCGRASAGL
jgi:hypothetical protein